MDVIAKTVCVCYSVSIETLQVVLGSKYNDALIQNMVKLAFNNSKNFYLVENHWSNKTVVDQSCVVKHFFQLYLTLLPLQFLDRSFKSLLPKMNWDLIYIFDFVYLLPPL